MNGERESIPPLFLVAKSSGGFGSILYLLKALNSFDEGSAVTIKSLKKGDWMALVNLSDTCLHMPTAAAHHRFLLLYNRRLAFPILMSIWALYSSQNVF